MPFVCGRTILTGPSPAMKRKFTFDANVLPIPVRYIAIRVDSRRHAANETLFARDRIWEKSRHAAG